MGAFEVYGGNRLKGDLYPQGAKNEALQVICAVLLTSEKVTISNIPEISDVMNLIGIMKCLGVKVHSGEKGTFTFQAEHVNPEILLDDDFHKKTASLRGSVMILGPILARFKKGYIARPGGDMIGRRRLDTHFLGFQELGATFHFDPVTNFYRVEASDLKGSYMLLDEASVTGTANIIMTAVLAKGRTTLFNAACEPYIQQLCGMLSEMGAKIQGVGSNLLTIDGVSHLNGCRHTILPDMIEIGSFIGLAAMTKSEITIKNVSWNNLWDDPKAFTKLGIKLELVGDDIFAEQEEYEIETFIDGSIMTIADAPWPGLTPDLLSIFLVISTQAKGSVLIHQKMFESRLFFVDKLIDMGAQIILCDPHRATVIGLNNRFKLRIYYDDLSRYQGRSSIANCCTFSRW